MLAQVFAMSQACVTGLFPASHNVLQGELLYAALCVLLSTAACDWIAWQASTLLLLLIQGSSVISDQ